MRSIVRMWNRFAQCYGFKDNSGKTYIRHGIDFDFTTSVKCENNWYEYDNQNLNLELG